MRTEKDYIRTIKKLHAALEMSEEKLNMLSEDVAVVGMACRFPGVNSPSDFDLLMRNRKDSWSEIPTDRWNPKYNDKFKSKGGGFLNDIDKFDNIFFKISTAEAKMMSPQQRLLLETSWHALENANIVPEELRGTNTGVFMGVGDDHFGILSSKDSSEQQRKHFVSGNALSTASGRLSYFYGFEGPNITLNTACSSSLVAIDQAVQSIRAGKCDSALVGGVNTILFPDSFGFLEDMQALSEDGKCKAFDSKANGYGRGEGCGVVVLKKVSDAIKDGNRILAVIKGSAVNQDGTSNGLTAPNGLAQYNLLKLALKNSNISAESVSFIEAHGTGTPLGDPIEIESLEKVYGKEKSKQEPLYISSVKSNLGHLENAAGVAAFIKTVLSVHHGVIYPQANFVSFNEDIKCNDELLVIPKQPVKWPENKVKRAGVSSFGFSGTNAHIIIEGYKNEHKTPIKNSKELIFCISSKTKDGLERLKATYLEFIQRTKPNIEDLCYTVACHRTHFKYKATYIVKSISELEDKLKLNNNLDGNKVPVIEFLSANNIGIEWQRLYGKKDSIELPVYPFEKNRFDINFSNLEEIDKNKIGQNKVEPLTVVSTVEDVHLYIGQLVSKVTEIPIEKLDFDLDVFDYGVDSLMIMHMQKDFKSKFGVEIKISMIYDTLNTINNLSNYITANRVETGTISKEINKTIGNAPILFNEQKKFVPYVSIKKKKLGGNKLDIDGLSKLIKDFSNRSQHSKDWTQKYRSFLANNRNIANFRPPIKEMTYQIVAEKAIGAYIFDAKGEKYLDMSMGFGVHLFGHNPKFLKSAMSNQIEKSMALGPMSPMAGQLAKYICEFTKNDRASFYNSGTEAVMVAIRLARAVTKKTKIVIFSGSYHGTFDGILGVSENGISAIPMAPGISPNMVADLIVLPYGETSSLAMIEELVDDLAAVLVEPIQSRYPELKPKEFLKRIRHITTDNNVAMIFDEVITGFRLAKGGAQEYYGIAADICTYGKVIGGGMPIGVVAGKNSYMNAVDGGFWSYGDKSFPTTENTFVAGTFCHHPLAMATGLSVINHLQHYPNLISDLNERNRNMCEELNTWFEEQNIPVSMVFMGSLFRFKMPTGYDFIYYYLLSKGIYIWEGRNCFISTAHSEEDLKLFVNMVKEGFLYLFPQLSKTTKKYQGFEPTPGQLEIWMATQKATLEYIYHLTESFEISGKLNKEVFEQAFNETVNTFDALTMTCQETDEGVRYIKKELNEEKYLVTEQVDHLAEIERIVSEQHQQVFALNTAPLWRAKLITSSSKSIFIFTIHHLICDGGSLEIIFRKLMQKYLENITGTSHKKNYHIESFENYTIEFNRFLSANKWKDQQIYWKSILQKIEPIDSKFLFYKSKTGNENSIKRKLTKSELTTFLSLHRKLKITPFALATALTHIACNLHLNMDKVLTLSPVTGRHSQEWNNTVGHLLNMIPIYSERIEFDNFNIFSNKFNSQVEKAYQNMEYPFTLLEEQWMKDKIKGSLLNVVEVSYENFGMRNSLVGAEEISIKRLDNYCVDMRKFPLEFRFYQRNNSLDYCLIFDPEVIDQKRAEKLIDSWKIMIEQLEKNHLASLDDLFKNVQKCFIHKEEVKQMDLKNKEFAMLLEQKK